jgi:hypothetical protein
MLFLALGLMLLSTPSFACLNPISTSNAEKAIADGPAKSEISCNEKPCLCADGIEWSYAELGDNVVLDYIDKKDVVSCASSIDCNEKFEVHTCSLGDYTKIKNYDLREVYCVKEITKVDGKKLVNSPVKKAAHEAKKEDDRLKEKEKKDKEVVDLLTILTTDMSKTMSTKEITDYLKKLQEVLKSKGIL